MLNNRINSFGKKLQYLRIMSDLKQKDVAAMLSVEPSTVSKWESSLTQPQDSSTYQLLSKIFGVTIDYLINEGIDTGEFRRK